MINILLQHEKPIKENIKTVVIAEDRYKELLESERKYQKALKTLI